MVSVGITVEESRLLKDYQEQAPCKLMRKKSAAVFLSAKSVPIEVVADFVDRKPSTVETWLKAWGKQRMASIISGHLGNRNASKLTPKQREHVNLVLSKPPSDAGIPADFWSVPQLAQWLSTEFDVVYESDTSYHFLLRHAGLSFHKPQPFDQRRPPEQLVETRMRELDRELNQAYADKRSIIMAADEVRLEHEAVVRKAWCPVGEKSVLKVDRVRKSQSYIGFLDQKTGSVELKHVAWQQSSTIIEALLELALQYRNKQVHIVWDNAAWHRSKELRAKLGPGKPLENIQLHYLPAYCPDKNPIEHVWGEAKTNISNIQRGCFAETKQAFEQFIRTNTFPYRLQRF